MRICDLNETEPGKIPHVYRVRGMSVDEFKLNPIFPMLEARAAIDEKKCQDVVQKHIVDPSSCSAPPGLEVSAFEPVAHVPEDAGPKSLQKFIDKIDLETRKDREAAGIKTKKRHCDSKRPPDTWVETWIGMLEPERVADIARFKLRAEESGDLQVN